MALKLATAPTVEPVTLAEAKAHLRVDAADEDALITSLIVAARQWCEGYQNRAYVTQTWDLALDAWPSSDRIEIPRPPLQSVTSLAYIDSDGASTSLDAAALATAGYIIDTASEPGRLVLGYGKSWPTVTLRPGGAITVRFVAGYGAAAAVPAGVKASMKLIVGHWHANRELVLVGSISEQLEMTAMALLGRDRILYV